MKIHEIVDLDESPIDVAKLVAAKAAASVGNGDKNSIGQMISNRLRGSVQKSVNKRNAKNPDKVNKATETIYSKWQNSETAKTSEEFLKWFTGFMGGREITDTPPNLNDENATKQWIRKYVDRYWGTPTPPTRASNSDADSKEDQSDSDKSKASSNVRQKIQQRKNALGPQGRNRFSPKESSQRSSSTALREGGNIFRDENKVPVTIRINRKDVDPTLAWLEKIVHLDLINNKLGTTGVRATSGDLDVAVDETKITKDELVSRLTDWVNKRNGNPRDWIRKSGISVHFKTPILGNDQNGFVQTDFMFGDPKWMAWSLRGASDEESKFRGAHRQILMSSIATAQGLKWSPQTGLTDRKTNKVLTKSPDEIARILLGSNANRSDLESVETIIDFIKNRPDYEDLVADARKTFARDGIELPESASKENRNASI